VLGDRRKVSQMRQYKSWEILAFLACHEEGGVSKDKVLAALWPDLDEDTAMNRLRVYMTRLRNMLTDQLPWLQDAKDVVRCDRDGLCRLDTDLVRSDVHRFRELCELIERQSLEEAQRSYDELRDLYRGELLDEPPTAGSMNAASMA
jgi:DNA-binding SARP family transcriptional activator